MRRAPPTLPTTSPIITPPHDRVTNDSTHTFHPPPRAQPLLRLILLPRPPRRPRPRLRYRAVRPDERFEARHVGVAQLFTASSADQCGAWTWTLSGTTFAQPSPVGASPAASAATHSWNTSWSSGGPLPDGPYTVTPLTLTNTVWVRDRPASRSRCPDNSWGRRRETAYGPVAGATGPSWDSCARRRGDARDQTISGRRRLVSILTPGPIVDDVAMPLRYRPFADARLGPQDLVEHRAVVLEQAVGREADLADRHGTRCRGGRCGTRPCRP